MRILYVTASLPYGPGETFIIPEIQALLDRGCEVLVVPTYPRGEVMHANAAFLLERTLREPIVSAPILRLAAKRIKRQWRGTWKQLADVIKRSRSFNIVKKNIAIYPKALWLSEIAEKWEADHIHCHWSSVSATMAMIASELTRIPWSFTAHRWDIVENNMLVHKAKSASFVRFISQSGLKMSGLSGESTEVTEKLEVLHMGVRLPDYVERYSHAVPHFTALCPANLLPVKGHRYLIEAAALLKERGRSFTLLFAGQGELREELERQVARYQLQDEVKFLGLLSHAELLGYYREGRIDTVILPSLDLGGGLHEGIPVSLIEAMSFGTPVISTSTGGIVELLADDAGILVDPMDAQALADAMDVLMHQEHIRRGLGEAGRRRVLEHFSIDAIAERLIYQFSSHSAVLAPTHHGLVTKEAVKIG